MNEDKSSLFKGGNNWELNAYIGYSEQSTSYCPMGMGYLRAANILSNHAIEARRELDILVYPIVFNYRHGIELYLKGYLEQIRRINGGKKDDFLNHNLMKKWEEIKIFIIENGLNESDKSGEGLVEIVEEAIEEFAKYDPDSYHFRYHISKSGEKNQKLLKNINIENLKMRMDKVGDVFMFWRDMINEMEDFYNETRFVP